MPRLGSRLALTVQQAGPPLWPLIAQTGCQWARISGNWYDLQPSPDQYTWAWLDAIVDGLTPLGVQSYVVIGYTPEWAAHGGARNTPPAPEDWYRFVRAFGEHFAGRVPIVGLWNEPNIAGMYNGPVQQYCDEIVRGAVDALKPVAPTIQVCGPELSTEGAWPAWLTTCLERVGDRFNVLTVHAYAKDGRAVWDALTRPTPWYEFWRKPSVKQVIQAAGLLAKPCWVTETGWQSGLIGEEAQAHHIQELLERLAGASWPSGLGWFQLIDEPTNSWGLYRQDYGLKPVGQVVQHAAR